MPRADPAPHAGPVGDAPGELLDLCVRAAVGAGRTALEGRRSLELLHETKSTGTDLVTQFDRAAEEFIVEAIRLARPDDAIVGEEGTSLDGTTGFEWHVDPIDGTTNFVYDLPAWCTSVGVIGDGATVAGAVYVPVTDELFTATAGGGARRNGEPIECSANEALELALLATGFSYRAETRTGQARRVAGMIGRVRDIRRSGSAAIDLCRAASGAVDAYFEEHLNSWDVVAGELIAREAGCLTSDFTGGPADPSNLVAAAPGIHAGLLALIADAD